MIPIFIIVCIVYFVYYYNKKKEQLEIEQIIDSKYINKLNRKDIIARRLPNKNIYSYYRHLVRYPTNSEKNSIENIFRVIKNDIGNKYKPILDLPFRTYIFSKIENNFPHTHHNSILIPEIFPLNNSYITKNTLLHEKLHIIQRFKKENFYRLYEKYWNFRYIRIKNLDRIEIFSRTNPDGLDNNWVFSINGINIVLMSLYNKNYKYLSDVTSYGIYLDKNSNLILPIRKKKLRDIKEFTDFFGNLNGNNYHPNEISADMLAGMLLGETSKSRAYDKLSEWWNTL
jgi:hypothetical protein